LGVNYNLEKNHFIGAEFYQFGELVQGGIIFEDEIPNRVKASNTLKFIYGYSLNLKSSNFKIIPAIGLGATSGIYRTNELSPDYNPGKSWYKSYVNTSFSGISISPQIDFIFHTSWGGIGLVVTHNTTFQSSAYLFGNWKTSSANDFALKICFGKMR